MSLRMEDKNGALHENRRGTIELQEQDPELYALIGLEKNRQRNCIELIASENFTSKAVLQCLGSCLTNKYSEGYPGRRFYGGNEYIDQIEILCQKRALKAFKLDENVWGVNVQPYSGSPANFEVYTALLRPHDRIMGMDLPSGGHLTHGFYSGKKKVSASSLFFESLPYKVNEQTGLLDYNELHKLALHFRPNLIIAGISAYPRALDYKRFREIADDVGAVLFADMAHVSGLVAAGLTNNPFEYCHVVTTTSHKTLRGPRSGVIFYNKKDQPKGGWEGRSLEDRINEAVFPGLQGGPHNHQIAALACQLKEVSEPGWVEYASQVKRNAVKLGECLIKLGYELVTGGTDCHLILWDLRNVDVSGNKMEEVCERCGIALNKNAVPGDMSALSPSGVRLGTPAMTTRGLQEHDFEIVAQFLHRSVGICKNITASHGRKLVDFRNGLLNNKEIERLKNDVESWTGKLPMPGHFNI